MQTINPSVRAAWEQESNEAEAAITLWSSRCSRQKVNEGGGWSPGVKGGRHILAVNRGLGERELQKL